MTKTLKWSLLALPVIGLVLMWYTQGQAVPITGRTGGQAVNRATPLGTIQSRWALKRTVTASDTPLTSITRAWTTFAPLAVPFDDWSNYTCISLYADGDGSGTGDPNGGSLNWKLYACPEWGSAQLMGYGTWAIGELALSHNPATGVALTYATTDPNSSKWGELPVVTVSYFGVTARGTTDDVGCIEFDSQGLYAWRLEVTGVTGLTNLYILARSY